jgi:hypothetical protein
VPLGAWGFKSPLRHHQNRRSEGSPAGGGPSSRPGPGRQPSRSVTMYRCREPADHQRAARRTWGRSRRTELRRGRSAGVRMTSHMPARPRSHRERQNWVQNVSSACHREVPVPRDPPSDLREVLGSWSSWAARTMTDAGRGRPSRSCGPAVCVRAVTSTGRLTPTARWQSRGPSGSPPRRVHAGGRRAPTPTRCRTLGRSCTPRRVSRRTRRVSV